MNIVCLDLEGVLVPEIWEEFSKAEGIPELMRTTRDEPDYDKLMRFRLDVLAEHHLGLPQIQRTIAKMDPLPGAKGFLDDLRAITQVVIVSDTFSQFAQPLMRKLAWPTILCNELTVAPDGTITGWKMRKAEKKEQVINHFQQMGYGTIASGDSHNDLGMIHASKAGFLFRTTPELAAANPDVPALETYGDLLEAIKANL